MYRLRKGRIVEASLIGGARGAGRDGRRRLDSRVAAGGAVLADQGPDRSRPDRSTASSPRCCRCGCCSCPRDYLSSFLKIGTVILLIAAVFVANPVLPSPMVNPVFQNGGPTFPGGIFPFVFICIMCGSISGFHALVSSGTTPKMVDKERQVRPIGYGAMLMEGVVGIVALIAAASLPPQLYYDINVGLDKAAKWQPAARPAGRANSGNAGRAHLPVEATNTTWRMWNAWSATSRCAAGPAAP